MIYGITGNTKKDAFWVEVTRLIQILKTKNLSFRLPESIILGLKDRNLLDTETLDQANLSSWTDADMILSFGGDGTIIHAAHDIAPKETPIIGINLGRLGFLADVETNEMAEAIEALEAGAYHLQDRMVLEAIFPDGSTRWALNEFVLMKSELTTLIHVETHLNDRFLCRYWADGLIISTPTGSTAYSLSAGGPILTPLVPALVVTPIAPHTLTMRPLVVPDFVRITANVPENNCPFSFVADGYPERVNFDQCPIHITVARHRVRLVALDSHDYFATIRSKLGWGQSFYTPNSNHNI